MHLQLSQLKMAQSGDLVVNHVPVVHCEVCGRSEVYAAVKESLYHVLASEAREEVDFEEFSECANHLVQLDDQSVDIEIWIERLCNRMDDLLDLLGFAISTNDRSWSDDIQRRLRELHITIQTTYNFS
jgi:hypothetical protein